METTYYINGYQFYRGTSTKFCNKSLTGRLRLMKARNSVLLERPLPHADLPICHQCFESHSKCLPRTMGEPGCWFMCVSTAKIIKISRGKRVTKRCSIQPYTLDSRKRFPPAISLCIWSHCIERCIVTLNATTDILSKCLSCAQTISQSFTKISMHLKTP